MGSREGSLDDSRTLGIGVEVVAFVYCQDKNGGEGKELLCSKIGRTFFPLKPFFRMFDA